MSTIPFNQEKELSVLGYYPNANPKAPKTPYFDTPVLPKENMRLLLEGKQNLWLPTMQDVLTVSPTCNPDNPARGFIMEPRPITDDEKGGVGLFGIEWEYVPVTGGSTVRPGEPLMEDANEWKEKLKDRMPHPDEWAWEENMARINCLIDDRRVKRCIITSGYFERLISFMDFSNAILALIDDDQKDAIHEMFNMLTDLYKNMVDNMIKYIGIDMIEIHDDWGSQRAPLFSIETIREMIVPHMKELNDYCKSKGVFVSLHSCGKNEMLVPAMIEAGFCMWTPQAINDFDYIIENYGDQIIIGINPDTLAPGLTEEQIKEKARALVAKYIDKKVFLFKSPSRHTKPEYELYFSEVYAESRRLLAEKNK